MDNTIDLIQKASKERLNLWRKAREHGLNKIETQLVQTMTTDLAILWDRYRREYAQTDDIKNDYGY